MQFPYYAFYPPFRSTFPQFSFGILSSAFHIPQFAFYQQSSDSSWSQRRFATLHLVPAHINSVFFGIKFQADIHWLIAVMHYSRALTDEIMSKL